MLSVRLMRQLIFAVASSFPVGERRATARTAAPSSGTAIWAGRRGGTPEGLLALCRSKGVLPVASSFGLGWALMLTREMRNGTCVSCGSW